MANAYGNRKYDFKSRGDAYRGMTVKDSTTGEKVYASARDIGNIGAGYIAGINGIPYQASGLAFDALESLQVRQFSTEGISTQNAEYYGWKVGTYQPFYYKAYQIWRSNLQMGFDIKMNIVKKAITGILK